MREIQFRGKRQIDGRWIYGSLIQTSLGHVRINGTNSLCEVDSDTVGQFTGVTDKKSRKIYEGDVVSHDFTGEIDVIAWVDGSLVSKDLKSAFVSVIYEGFAKHLTVLGNIHDNPELLEVKR